MNARRLVIVVEDSDDDFDTLEQAVQRSGVTVRLRRCCSGDELMPALRQEADRTAFVILDLNTPGSDGRDALAAFKADPALRMIPAIVVTTSSNPRDVAYCYDTGASTYHVKPVRYDEHVGLISEVFRYWLIRTTLPEAGADP